VGNLAPGTAVTVRNGRFHASGEVVGAGEKPGTVRVFAFKNKFDVAEGYVMAQDARQDLAMADVMECGFDQQARNDMLEARIVELEAERDALAEVVAAQMELIG